MAVPIELSEALAQDRTDADEQYSLDSLAASQTIWTDEEKARRPDLFPEFRSSYDDEYSQRGPQADLEKGLGYELLPGLGAVSGGIAGYKVGGKLLAPAANKAGSALASGGTKLVIDPKKIQNLEKQIAKNPKIGEQAVTKNTIEDITAVKRNLPAELHNSLSGSTVAKAAASDNMKTTVAYINSQLDLAKAAGDYKKVIDLTKELNKLAKAAPDQVGKSIVTYDLLGKGTGTVGGAAAGYIGGKYLRENDLPDLNQ